mmetsp:Transcript_24037/g.58392  ORF Transcript_24037/g.58392 Transcript_24037/m.58392 type:complete len:309 (+) Transcript_24037:821-1747(+)
MLLHLALKIFVVVLDGKLYPLLFLHLLFHVLLPLFVLLSLENGHALHVALLHSLQALALPQNLLFLGLLLAPLFLKLLLHHSAVALDLLASLLCLPFHFTLHLLLLPLKLCFCQLAVKLQLQLLLLTLLLRELSPPVVELFRTSGLLLEALHLHIVVVLNHGVSFLRVPQLLKFVFQGPCQPLLFSGLHKLELFQLLLHCPVLRGILVGASFVVRCRRQPRVRKVLITLSARGQEIPSLRVEKVKPELHQARRQSGLLELSNRPVNQVCGVDSFDCARLQASGRGEFCRRCKFIKITQRTPCDLNYSF